MIATLAFSLIAAGLVLLAGRKDAARDPRLTLFQMQSVQDFLEWLEDDSEEEDESEEVESD